MLRSLVVVGIGAECAVELKAMHREPSWLCCIAGAKFLTNEEAQMVGELNMRHSHATHDLYNRILEGNPPEWTWYVQVSIESHCGRSNPFDNNPALLDSFHA